VIHMIYYQGKKLEEVAQLTGTPINTRLHCARNRMSELLNEAGVDESWVAV
jgi:DNA-directed RNA polymerase specialized sigma24 family protein